MVIEQLVSRAGRHTFTVDLKPIKRGRRQLASPRGTVDTGSVRIKVAYCVKRVRFPYLGNDSDGR